MLNNIAAFVQCKEAGERVVRMFKKGARLDYRDHEPDRVQVKIGACDTHLPNLVRLEYFCSDGMVNRKKILDARELRPVYRASLKVEASRRGQVDVLSKILRDDLSTWARQSAKRTVTRGEITLVPKYQISILSTDSGYTRQLIDGNRELICALHAQKDNPAITELHLAMRMPVGPWDRNLVVKLFIEAHGKEAVIPQGVVMPKITGSSIKPEEATSWREAGYELDIKFENAPFGAKAVEQQTNLISRAMNYELGSSDCCHFFTNSVCMSFPTKKAATNALARVQNICPM